MCIIKEEKFFMGKYVEVVAKTVKKTVQVALVLCVFFPTSHGSNHWYMLLCSELIKFSGRWYKACKRVITEPNSCYEKVVESSIFSISSRPGFDGGLKNGQSCQLGFLPTGVDFYPLTPMLFCLVGVCLTVGFSQNILQLQLLPNLLPQESTTCYKYVWCVLQKSKVCLAPGSHLPLVFPKLRYQLSLSVIPSPSAASLFTTRIIFGLVWQSSLQKCVRTLIFFVCVSK